MTVEVVQKRIDEFKALWNNAINPNEQNQAFKLLIDWIVYNRKDNDLKPDILYK